MIYYIFLWFMFFLGYVIFFIMKLGEEGNQKGEIKKNSTW